MSDTLLAINTTTRDCSVALIHAGQSYVATEYSERGHDGIVLALVDNVLEQAGIKKQTIECLAFGRGPGAFTGIRVATAVTQGLAVGLDVPVVPVSDLLNIAYQQHLTTNQNHIITCIDARMGEIYSAEFEFSEESFVYKQEEQLLKPDVLMAESSIGAGNGFTEYPELIDRLSLNSNHSDFTLVPTALAAAQLALRYNLPRVSAIDALPVYLRNDVTS